MGLSIDHLVEHHSKRIKVGSSINFKPRLRIRKKWSELGYNLMSLFRTFLLQEKTQKTLSTLRYRTFAVGAYFTKVNDKLVLKIALNKKRRAWFTGLWNYSKAFEYPFIFSNA